VERRFFGQVETAPTGFVFSASCAEKNFVGKFPIRWAEGAKPTDAEWVQYRLLKPGQPDPDNPPTPVANPWHFGTVTGTLIANQVGGDQRWIIKATHFAEYYAGPID